MPDRPSESASTRPALVAVAVIAAALALAIARDRPPAPRGVETPANEFSAARAHDTLARLLGDERPHPVGSEANAAVRERLLAEIRKLGLSPQVRTRLACNSGGTCATVSNVFARLPAVGSGKAILLLAHYDSVPAGPGAGDDGSGTATLLETARALLAGGRLARPVWLLWTDGEEAGLLGAEAFAREPEAREIGFLLNFEARGASGRSVMFETGPEHAGAIGAMAAVDPHPAANSLSYEIYRRLPNDTDYTVFKRLDVPGFNFAFIGAPLRYHTPQDSLAHLDLGSLQHDGDHALALTRELVARGLESTGGGGAQYFDLAGFALIHWPTAWTLPLAGAALALVLLAILRRRAETRAAGLLLGIVLVIARLALAFTAAWIVQRALVAAGPLAGHWIARPELYTVGFLLIGLAVAALSAGLGRRRASSWERALATALVWAALATILAAKVPGAAFLLLAPALLAGIALVLGASRRKPPASLLFATALAGVLMGALAQALPVALGLEILPAVALLGALVATLASPAFEPPGGRLAARVFALVALVAFVGALTRPRFTADQPEPLSLRYVESEADTFWYVEPGAGRLPAPLAKAAAWSRQEGRALPWSRPGVAFRAPATRHELGAPTVTVESVEPLANGDRRFHLRVRSARGAPLAIVRFPPEVAISRLAVEDWEMSPPGGRFADAARGRLLVFSTLPAEGQSFVVETATAGALPVDVDDQSVGLPGDGEGLLAARGRLATPIGFGDATIVLRHYELASSAPSPNVSAPGI